MDKKTKDSTFAIGLILIGAYVVIEGMRMVDKASKPPFNISHFSISPGMLPVILGAGLVFFSILLLINNLRGENRPGAAFWSHMRTSSVRFRQAFGDIDMRSMMISVVIMFLYTFFFLGRVPFWVGAVLFLVVLTSFLRAGKIWVILLTSGISVALIVLLFEGFFKTTLP
jgi:hypothetical protein